MPMAVRMNHRAPGFMAAVRHDVAKLAGRYPKGFVVRLHELGVRTHSLHVFGYSHRKGKIGDALDAASMDNEDGSRSDLASRFRIMDSNLAWYRGKAGGHRGFPRESDSGTKLVTCPEQTGRTASCSTCGLCMGRANQHSLFATLRGEPGMDFSKFDPEEIIAAVQEDADVGFCVVCGAERHNTEPDAREYNCESCGDPKSVYGAEKLLLMGACG